MNKVDNVKNYKKSLLLVFIAIFVGIWQLGILVFRSFDAEKIQQVTGFRWPQETKALQWRYSSMQGTWVKVHLQLPDSFVCNTNMFSRFNFAYLGEYDPLVMNRRQWERQQRVWRAQKGLVWFEDMKRQPITGSNLMFAANIDFPWVIVYDEKTKQMWIHCF
jgi:hypothetical protein